MSTANQKPAASPDSDCRTGPQLKAFVKEGPSAQTFDLAVKRHQLVDMIQKASDTGIRQIL
jgi:hypothetical protein